MRVEIARTTLRHYTDGKLRAVRTVQANFDIPADRSTTIYIDQEPALVIEPDLSA